MKFPADATEVVQIGSTGAINTGDPWMPTTLYGLGWQTSIANRALSQTRGAHEFPVLQFADLARPIPGATDRRSNSPVATSDGLIQTSSGATVQTINLNFPSARFQLRS